LDEFAQDLLAAFRGEHVLGDSPAIRVL